MKLIHPEISLPIIEDTYICYEWIIELPRAFSKYVQELFNQINGGEGNFVLSCNEQEMDISKSMDIIINPFSVNINERKIINKLYTELSQTAYNSENYLFTQNLLSEIQKYFLNLEQSSNYILEMTSEIDMIALFKALDIKLEIFADDFFEKLNQYIKILAELMKKKVIVFVNISSYFSKEQLEELIKNAAYNEVNLLFIENQQKGYSLKDTKYTIIDKDECEIC